MNTLNYTKGEWKVDESHWTVGIENDNGGTTVIADIFGGIIGKDTPANAHLISAAPMLYEALKSLIFTASKLWDEAKPIKDTEAMTVTHPIIERAKQALAKAEGKQ